MKVACIQLCSGLSRARNVSETSALVREAAQAGAELIATPEMTNVVDRKPRRLFEDLPFADDLEEAETFGALAKELGIHLLVGSMAVALSNGPGQRKAANRAFFYGPSGQVLATYDKLHMFDVDLPDGESWKESSIYAPGETAPCVETPVGRLGLTICYDLRFPHLYRALAKAGAEILMVPGSVHAPDRQGTLGNAAAGQSD